MELNDRGRQAFPDNTEAQKKPDSVRSNTNDASSVQNSGPSQLYEIQANENMNLEDIYDLSEQPYQRYD